MQEIIIATKNSGKAKEFCALFEPYGMMVKTLLDFDKSIPEIKETGTTFYENARLKAEGIAGLLKKPVVADDSGLVVRALDGQPGVYSARYAGEPKDDKRNNEKLLDELANTEDRSAYFNCVLAFCIPNKETIYAEGKCPGKIAEKLIGDNGFGYDPLFIPDGYNRTMAQLDSEEKNRISHRYYALKNLEELLQESGLLGDRYA